MKKQNKNFPKLKSEIDWVAMDMRDAFFAALYEIGKKDKDAIVLTDDMDAWGLRRFKKDFPDRCINVGVAEQNMIDVAAGLAACGKRVFAYGICTYVTMRSYEQIKFSVCGMNLPVTIVGVGTGFSFAFDGPTHHGTQDLGLMRGLPEIAIYNPSDACSAALAAYVAYESKSPAYIRLDKGTYPSFYKPNDTLAKGYKIIKPMSATNIISTGGMTERALEAIQKIEETRKLKIGLIDLCRVKPLSEKFFKEVIAPAKKIITLEEHSLTNGIGSLVAELMADKKSKATLERIALPDKQFLLYGSREWFHKKCGLDVQSIIQKLI